MLLFFFLINQKYYFCLFDKKDTKQILQTTLNIPSIPKEHVKTTQNIFVTT